MSVALELLVKQKGHPDRRVPLTPGVVVLGRSEDVDLCLADIGVSRRHARIITDEHGVTYEDLNSGNGSWFMGKRVRTQSLAAGDVLVIEPFHLHFIEPPRSARQAPVLEPVLATDPGIPVAELEVLTGHKPDPGTRFEIPLTGLRIGRSEKEDVTLADASASRHHAAVIRQGGVHILRDPGSANGLYVNDKRVSEHTLRHGDVIKIGDTELRFVSKAAPLQPAPVLPPIQEYSDRTEAFDKDLAARMLAEEDAQAEAEEAQARAQAEAQRQEAQRQEAQRQEAQRQEAQRQQDQQQQDQQQQDQQQQDQQQQDQAAPQAAPPGPPPFAGLGTPSQAPAMGAPAMGAAGFGAPVGGFGGPAPTPAGPDAPAFGGAAGGLGGKAPSSGEDKRGFFSKPINLISVGLMALTGLAVAGKGFMNSIQVNPGSGEVTTTSLSSANLDLSSADAALVQELMEEGMERFTAEDYAGASAKFLRVLQLDPGHPDAERMGYISVEFITIQALQAGLQRKASSEADRAQSKVDALTQAEEALRGRSSIGAAQKAVRVALNLNPQDEELEAANERLRRKAGAAQVAAKERQTEVLVEDLSGPYKTAQAALDAGKYADAIKGFNAILSKDPSGKTPYAAKATAGLSQARSSQRDMAEGPYKKGVSAMGSGDMLGARRHFQEALRYDPTHSRAGDKLSEINSGLQRQAMDKFQEGKVYEKANQADKALSSYSECQRLLGDRSSDLHKSAQARIDALLQ
ncbi:MAG: pSer/pThr/pTyr-binding forkhead associated (FHA) protein [Cognaticolwellia sp.]|jgi:pSer/pThr/pTyr-binding forkhead associated (FHA) protein